MLGHFKPVEKRLLDHHAAAGQSRHIDPLHQLTMPKQTKTGLQLMRMVKRRTKM